MIDIFKKLKQEVGGEKKSVTWYQTKIKKLGAINTPQLLKKGDLKTRVIPGYMYLYAYNPKTRSELPYYDIYPLVFPFRRTNTGFYGINLHYMPYGIRIRVIQQLMIYASNKKMNEMTKIRFTYRTLESAARLKPAKASIKHYLNEQVRSRFLKIPSSEWIIASQLPVQRFRKVRMEQVWRETRRKTL